MAGINIIVQNADFSETATRWAADVPDGLVYANFFTSSDVLARNLVSGGDAATVVGTPTISSNWMTVTHGSNYIQTPAPQTADFTWLVVTRQQAESTGHIIGNYIDGVTSQGTLYWAEGAGGDSKVNLSFSTSIFNNPTISPNVQTTALRDVPTGPQAISARYNSATALKTVNMLTLALAYTNTPAYPMPTPGTTNIRLGQGQTGSTEIAAALIWNTVLSDVDLAAAYAQVKAFMASKSITV